MVCFFYSEFTSLKYIFWVLFSFYWTPKDRIKLVLNLHSWKTIYLKIIAMFLLSFWCTTFIFLSLCWCISSGDEKIFGYFLFELVSHVIFAFTFWCFLNVIHYSKRMRILWYSVSFCPLSKKLTRFCVLNFLTVCHVAKKKI